MRWPVLEEYVIGLETLLLALYVGVSFFKAIPTDSQQTVSLIIGAFIGHIGTFISYKWGSSAGSAAKDETIARVLPPTPPRVP